MRFGFARVLFPSRARFPVDHSLIKNNRGFSCYESQISKRSRLSAMKVSRKNISSPNFPPYVLEQLAHMRLMKLISKIFRCNVNARESKFSTLGIMRCPRQEMVVHAFSGKNSSAFFQPKEYKRSVESPVVGRIDLRGRLKILCRAFQASFWRRRCTPPWPCLVLSPSSCSRHPIWLCPANSVSIRHR